MLPQTWKFQKIWICLMTPQEMTPTHVMEVVPLRQSTRVKIPAPGCLICDHEIMGSVMKKTEAYLVRQCIMCILCQKRKSTRVSCYANFLSHLNQLPTSWSRYKQVLHLTSENWLIVVTRHEGEFLETSSCCSDVYSLKILQYVKLSLYDLQSRKILFLFNNSDKNIHVKTRR